MRVVRLKPEEHEPIEVLEVSTADANDGRVYIRINGLLVVAIGTDTINVFTKTASDFGLTLSEIDL